MRLIPLVDGLLPAIEPFLDRPFIFFGHSFGALVAFELVRHLRKCSLPQPDMLIVSGCRAPHLPDHNLSLHGLPDAEFLEALNGFNGISSALLEEPELLDLFLPVLRADFESFETYVYETESPLNSHIMALGGVHDPRVQREELEAWASQTTSLFQSEYFPGDHFFINSAREAIIPSITGEPKVSP